ncbi:MAG: hypothetical protein ONA69_00210 [candidate division KSB1 bacterium]|nr:hypothetical protein [candidate division KSB1 bacterium]MDZ7345194.1 hypothetical protein [candidate division KSB1 bacterium]
MNKSNDLLRFVMILSASLFMLCGRRQTPMEGEKVLVRIGDKATITVNEFIARAEYWPRPDYCRQNNYIDKKIVLNSLVAEKLMAMEAGEDCPLLKNEGFQLFLKGRKEQAMRQWMHHVEATAKVKLDTAEIKKTFRLAGREYELAYFSTRDTAVVNRFRKTAPRERDFEGLFQQIAGEALPPTRKVAYDSPEAIAVHKALFSQPLQVGQILEPIKLETGDYLFIKILGWSDNLAVTETQQQQRLDKVKEKLTQVHASEIWTKRVAQIMKGKRLDFNPEVFRRVSQMLFKVYFRTDEERKDQLAGKIWQIEEKDMQLALEDMPDEQFKQQPFFQIDGQVWTVADFQRALLYHPLVFRERRFPSDQFAEQLRLAIADLVRDEYVTREAYKRGYDRVPAVERHTAMWRDAYLALYQRAQYLKSVGETRNFNKNYHDILATRLNPYVRSLFQKHYKKIELDFDAFENIALTSIDMLVKQPEQPFKYPVPNFPILTSEHLIDYATRMK